MCSICCLLEKLTQNPFAGTMLGPGSACREYKNSKIRTVQLHSSSEELKEKMWCIRFRKDIKIANFVFFKALERKARDWWSNEYTQRGSNHHRNSSNYFHHPCAAPGASEGFPKLHHISSPNSSIFIYLYPVVTSLGYYWHWATPGKHVGSHHREHCGTTHVWDILGHQKGKAFLNRHGNETMPSHRLQIQGNEGSNRSWRKGGPQAWWYFCYS